MTTTEDDIIRREALALAFSRPLDVHRWSQNAEVDAWVDAVYAQCVQGKPSQIERKHVKVVLLDLYVASLEHPDLKLAVAMRPAEYSAKSRYNALRISKKIIDAVNLLHDAGLIDMKRGYYERQNGKGRRTRIWPTAQLRHMFDQCQFGAYTIGRAAEEEVIILRDDKGKDEQYADTPETLSMRQVVYEYNALLSRTLIDIRQMEQPWIELGEGRRVLFGPTRQRVSRVFNRSSFTKGGRFYGPWWQGCPKEWRKQIFINDAPTIEQDYSSLHIALLYARRGINYYTTYDGDAYQLDTPPFLSSPQMTRKYAKSLLLVAVNAKTDKKAYAAFRSERRQRGDTLGGGLEDGHLSYILDGLKRKHPLIANDLGSDAGIDLMNEDSRITEHVIRALTEQNIPVLTIHDSYIVRYGDEKLLQQVLDEGFSLVTGLSGIKTELTGVVMGDTASWETQRLTQRAVTRSTGYRSRVIDWMTSGRG